MRIYVITVNYHGTADTMACVASLRKSTIPISITVVDNTPNDPDLEAALAPFSNVKLIRSPDNLGFGRGNNLGISWALSDSECEFIFLVNNDALVEAETINSLIDAAITHPSAGIIAPKIVLYDQPSVLWYGGGNMDWRQGGATAPGINGPSNAEIANKSRYVDYASGCAMFIRRSFIEQTGMFDERFFMYEEDVNLCLRGKELGFRIWYSPEIIVYHKRQGSMASVTGKYFPPLHPHNNNLYFFLYNIVRNRVINLIDHTKSRQRMLYVFGMCVWLARKAAIYAIYGNFKAIGIIVSACMDGYKATSAENG